MTGLRALILPCASTNDLVYAHRHESLRGACSDAYDVNTEQIMHLLTSGPDLRSTVIRPLTQRDQIMMMFMPELAELADPIEHWRARHHGV